MKPLVLCESFASVTARQPEQADPLRVLPPSFLPQPNCVNIALQNKTFLMTHLQGVKFTAADVRAYPIEGVWVATLAAECTPYGEIVKIMRTSDGPCPPERVPVTVTVIGTPEMFATEASSRQFYYVLRVPETHAAQAKDLPLSLALKLSERQLNQTSPMAACAASTATASAYSTLAPRQPEKKAPAPALQHKITVRSV